MSDNIDLDEIEHVQEQVDKLDAIIADKLTEKVKSSQSLIATKTISGESVSYLSSAPATWIAKNISLFVEMKSASNMVETDDNGNYSLVVDEKTSNDIKQRKPDFARAHLIALYLLSQKHPQFPPFLLVVEDDWCNMTPDDPDYVKYWDEERRARKSVIDPTFSFSDDIANLLPRDQFDKNNCYVIDGSHRTIALQAIENFERLGTLEKRQRDGARVAESLQDTDLEAIIGISAQEINDAKRRVMKSSFGVQFFSAVEAGETREEASRRVRSLFVHINKTAKAPTGSENVLLDDDNGFAIVARSSGFDHELFCKDKPGDLIDTKKPSLAINSVQITAIGLLKDTTEDYLSNFSDFERWKTNTAREIALRPDDEALNAAEKLMDEFFDKVKSLPIFKTLFKDSTFNRDVFIKDDNGDFILDDEGNKSKKTALIKHLRNFYDPNLEEAGIANHPDNRGHLLLRPLGHRILASAVGQLVNEGIDLETIFKKLEKFDSNGGFDHINTPQSVFHGLVYNPANKKMEMKHRKLSSRLLIYMLGGVTETESLREDYAEARSIMDNHYNFDGETVSSKDEIELPETLRP